MKHKREWWEGTGSGGERKRGKTELRRRGRVNENEIMRVGDGGGGGGDKSGVLVSNQGLIFGCWLIVGASGYLAPFRQIFCLDWFLLWASERLICQMHKALHICPASPTRKVNASLFISDFAFFFPPSFSLFSPFPPLFVPFHLSSLDRPLFLFCFHALLPLFVTIVRNRVQDFFLCVYNYPACIAGPAPGLPSASFVPLPPCVSFVFVFPFIKW